jgi:glutamate racemase
LRGHGFPVIGVIEPGARRAVERTRAGRIGVIGTRATVTSGAYPRAIQARLPDAQVISAPCPLFVPLAEEGWTEDAIARAVAERYLAPFREAQVDTLVLGCTHYPLLRAVIAGTMGPDVDLVDSAESVASEVRERLDRRDPPAAAVTKRVEHHFYVTDAPEPFQKVAERFLGRSLARLARARIEGEERIVNGEA